MIDQTDNVFDLNAVLHPGTVFDHPRDVVADATLSLAEKRAILASWASDAAAVTSNPALRELAGTRRIVTIDEVLEALSMLDDKPPGPPGGTPMRGAGGVDVAISLLLHGFEAIEKQCLADPFFLSFWSTPVGPRSWGGSRHGRQTPECSFA
jgi:hypothetical protein